MNVHPPTLPVEAVLAFAALFYSLSSCLLIILWTPSGNSKLVCFVMISSRICYLLSCFFLFILSSKLFSQYQGKGLAWNLYSSWLKSQWGSVDLGLISLSEHFTMAIISSLNFSSLSFLYLYCYFNILSYKFSLTYYGTSLIGIGFISSWYLRSFSSSIYLTFLSLIDSFFFLSRVSKPKGRGIVTLNFLPGSKLLAFLIYLSLSCFLFFCFLRIISLNSSSLEAVS